MSDPKYTFTDDEIVKALELCSKLDFSFKECDKCPYKGECGTKDGNMPADALALINRQKAVIKILEKHLVFEIESAYDRGSKAAIKEFAERLKVKAGSIPQYHFNLLQVEDDIDTLVKEMTEAKK